MHPTTRLALNTRGIWEIRYTTCDAEGRPHGRKASTGQTDKNAAETYRIQWLKAWHETTDVLSSPTVAEIIEAYLRDCNQRGIRNTQDYALSIVKRELGKYQPKDLSGRPMVEYKAGREGVSPSTVRRELGALMAALHWAAHPEKGRLITAEEVPQILLPQARHEERKFLNEAEEEKFLALALAWRFRRVGLYVAIGLNTGARKEAIEQLTWDRVDLEAGIIDFRVPGRMVTKKRRVATPINSRLRPVLEAIPVEERVGRVAMEGNIRKAFATFVGGTPFPWVTSHTMRHTYITLALRAGVEVWEVSQLVGDTPEIITRHYGHHQSDWHLHTAANKRFAP